MSTSPELKTAETAEPVTLVTGGELVGPLGEKMPPVTEGQERGPALPETPSPSPTAPAVSAKDNTGTKFSPARHKANPDGTPYRNRSGNFVYRSDYRKGRDGKKNNGSPGDPNISQTGANPSPSTPEAIGERPPPSFAADPQASSEPVDEYSLMAEVYLQSAYGPLIIALSEEARPDVEEHSALKQSLAAWLRLKQCKELSPGWAFGLCAVAVFVKKTGKPTVKERLALWGMKIKSWLGKDKK